MTTRDLDGWTIAFDLDGTLVETHRDLVGTLNRMLVRHDLPEAPIESAAELIGGGARALLQHGFELAGASWEEAHAPALFEEFLADYLEHIADHSRPFEGVVETLEALAARGAVLCVATNKRSDLSEILLGKLDLTRHFAAIVGPDRVSARKPSGRHLIEAVKTVGGNPAKAVMVGDAAPDTGAARDAGMPCIVCTFGYSPVAPADLGGTVLVDRFGDIGRVITGLIAQPALAASNA
jgi:phosphoglycolate phosphatase